jgi:hypothetical protein
VLAPSLDQNTKLVLVYYCYLVILLFSPAEAWLYFFEELMMMPLRGGEKTTHGGCMYCIKVLSLP